MSDPRDEARFAELLRRELDGEATPADRAALAELCARDEALARRRAAYARDRDALRALAGTAPPASPSFTAHVMQRLERPRRRSWWSLLLQPRAIRVRPAVAAAVVLAMAVAAVVLPRLHGPHAPTSSPAPSAAVAASQPASAPAACDPDVVLVRLMLPAKGAREVAVAGDFNGWSTHDTLLADQHGTGVYSVTVPLRRGRAYAYKFVVDGRWVDDPLAESYRADGFGDRNALVRP